MSHAQSHWKLPVKVCFNLPTCIFDQFSLIPEPAVSDLDDPPFLPGASDDLRISS